MAEHVYPQETEGLTIECVRIVCRPVAGDAENDWDEAKRMIENGICELPTP
ncbi:hypothetical protein Q31b_00950 [Novipirellula aureliae]|uniref:Uncharacterized protein n=1 Tax=Novipirellula aureliae TaxID=2527966 RepID=A0A5C6E8N8_9BACT|nr:hypothetical protein Q31b_00950 [Novipirellula aureliae]